MKHELILASQSPRRRQMIAWLQIPVLTAEANIDERPCQDESPRQLAGRLSISKALKVRESFNSSWILAADTVVDRQELILGKPSSAIEAETMLKELRGVDHLVHTAISLLAQDTKLPTTYIVTTDVWMRAYSDTEVTDYVASGDPMDKAGAYAIQHQGFHPVQRLNRCYANVVGLPLCALMRMLNGQFDTSADPYQLCEQQFGYRCPGKDEGTQL